GRAAGERLEVREELDRGRRSEDGAYDRVPRFGVGLISEQVEHLELDPVGMALEDPLRGSASPACPELALTHVRQFVGEEPRAPPASNRSSYCRCGAAALDRAAAASIATTIGQRPLMRASIPRERRPRQVRSPRRRCDHGTRFGRLVAQGGITAGMLNALVAM